MKLIYLLLFLSINIRCFSQKSNLNLIKEINEYSFRDSKTGNILRKSRLYSTSSFDSIGKKVKEVFYNNDCHIDHVTTYDYDDLGHCIAITNFSGKGEKIKENIAKRDKTGNTIPFLITNSYDFCKQDSPLVQCKYNKKGYISEAIKYDEVYKNMIILKLKYKYKYW